MVENHQKRELALNEMAQELYGELRRIKPMYPWVVVRVLPRQQEMKSGLFLPANQQNKTVHEGIVVQTWATHRRERGLKYQNGQWHTRVEVLRSELYPGDHVLFPHWAGLPSVGLNEDQYRLVKETDWEASKEGGIFAVVDYTGREQAVRNKLRETMESYIPDQQLSLLLNKLENDFLLIDRAAGSVTLSGT